MVARYLALVSPPTICFAHIPNFVCVLTHAGWLLILTTRIAICLASWPGARLACSTSLFATMGPPFISIPLHNITHVPVIVSLLALINRVLAIGIALVTGCYGFVITLAAGLDDSRIAQLQHRGGIILTLCDT